MSNRLIGDWVDLKAHLPRIGQRVRIRLSQPQMTPYDRLPEEVDAVFGSDWFDGTPVFTPDWIKPDGNQWCLYVRPPQIACYRAVANIPDQSQPKPRRRYNLTPEGLARRQAAMRAYWTRRKGAAA